MAAQARHYDKNTPPYSSRQIEEKISAKSHHNSVVRSSSREPSRLKSQSGYSNDVSPSSSMSRKRGYDSPKPANTIRSNFEYRNEVPRKKDRPGDNQSLGLPDDDDCHWSRHISSSNGKVYFYNRHTEQSQWEMPKDWKDPIEREYKIKGTPIRANDPTSTRDYRNSKGASDSRDNRGSRRENHREKIDIQDIKNSRDIRDYRDTKETRDSEKEKSNKSSNSGIGSRRELYSKYDLEPLRTFGQSTAAISTLQNDRERAVEEEPMTAMQLVATKFLLNHVELSNRKVAESQKRDNSSFSMQLESEDETLQDISPPSTPLHQTLSSANLPDFTPTAPVRTPRQISALTSIGAITPPVIAIPKTPQQHTPLISPNLAVNPHDTPTKGLHPLQQAFLLQQQHLNSPVNNTTMHIEHPRPFFGISTPVATPAKLPAPILPEDGISNLKPFFGISLPNAPQVNTLSVPMPASIIQAPPSPHNSMVSPVPLKQNHQLSRSLNVTPQAVRLPHQGRPGSTTPPPPPPPPPFSCRSETKDYRSIKVERFRTQDEMRQMVNNHLRQSPMRISEIPMSVNNELSMSEEEQRKINEKNERIYAKPERTLTYMEVSFSELPSLEEYLELCSNAVIDFTNGFYGNSLERQGNTCWEETMVCLYSDGYRSKFRLCIAKNELDVQDTRLSVTSDWLSSLAKAGTEDESFQNSKMSSEVAKLKDLKQDGFSKEGKGKDLSRSNSRTNQSTIDSKSTDIHSCHSDENGSKDSNYIESKIYMQGELSTEIPLDPKIVQNLPNAIVETSESSTESCPR